MGPEDYDAFVSAEIPDPIGDEQLHAIVTKTMMHDPCSARCLGPKFKCTKRFPRPFANVTTATSSGFPMYRRRNDGRFTEIHGQRLDNRYLVPYSPLLSKLFDAHVNVEIVASLATHKYIFKYITKGADYARAAVASVGPEIIDEIDRHIEGRYLSCSEAAWRILSFPVHARSHAIIRLHLHLENQHLIRFNPDKPAEQALVLAQNAKSNLMAFFDLCQEDPRAGAFTFLDIRNVFSWDKATKA
jgi:hypothetical protein